MDISIQADTGMTTLRIAGAMTIYEAAAGKPMLLRAVRAAQPKVDLDLSDVTEIDTAGLQLLVLAKREATRSGRACAVARHSAATQEATRLLNLGEAL